MRGSKKESVKIPKFSEKTVHEYIILLFYVIASYFTMRIHFLLGREYAPSRLTDLALGKAALPFQFRMLVPYLVRFISILTKSDIITTYASLEFLFLVGLFIAYRNFLCLFFKRNLADIFPFVLAFVLPFNYGILTTMFYPSDFPAIFFFTLALIAMYKEDWQSYYLIYAIATLNRETTCFLTFIYMFVFFRKMSITKLSLHLLIQTAMWLGIKQILYQIFRNNPGGLYENHINANIKMFLEILSFKIYNIVNLLLNFGGLWVLAIPGYKNAPPFLKASTLVLIPFIIGMFLVGNLYEMRIYGELLPIIVTLSLYPISRFIEQKETIPTKIKDNQ